MGEISRSWSEPPPPSPPKKRIVKLGVWGERGVEEEEEEKKGGGGGVVNRLGAIEYINTYSVRFYVLLAFWKKKKKTERPLQASKWASWHNMALVFMTISTRCYQGAEVAKDKNPFKDDFLRHHPLW